MIECTELTFQAHVHRSNPYHIVQAKKGPEQPTLSSFSPRKERKISLNDVLKYSKLIFIKFMKRSKRLSVMKAALHRKQNLHIEAIHSKSERRGGKTSKYVKKEPDERQYRIGTWVGGEGNHFNFPNQLTVTGKECRSRETNSNCSTGKKVWKLATTKKSNSNHKYLQRTTVPSELFYCKVAHLQRDKDTPCTEQQKQQHSDKNLIERPVRSSLLYSQYQCHVEKFPVFQHSLERQQKQLFYN
jgi:hypothetical protein